MGLSQRLFLVVLAALIPTIVIVFMNLVALRSAAQSDLHTEAEQTMRITVLEVERILSGTENVLRTASIGLDSAAQPVVPASCDMFLSNIVASLTQFQSIAIADGGGKIICASDPVLLGSGVAADPTVRSAWAEDRFFVGGYVEGRGEMGPSLSLALPVPKNGLSEARTMIAHLDLDWLGERIKDRSYVDGRAVTLADRDGRILAREPLPERFVGTRIPESFLYLVTAPEAGTLELTSQDGTRRVVGYHPATASVHNLYVSTGIPVAPRFASVDSILQRNALVGAIGIVSALLLARAISTHFIHRPFQRLIETLECWQNDNFDARTKLPAGMAEFGRAGRALDQFMDALTTSRARRQEADQKNLLLMAELEHRVKNLIATVQAVARQTFKGTGQEDALTVFTERLAAMGATHSILLKDTWREAPLHDLIGSVTAPFEAKAIRRITLNGPVVNISSRAAMALGMAFHELCTNAVKYGALSTAAGQVRVDWRVIGDDATGTLELVWREEGGPIVRPPDRRGFGSRMIETVLAMQIKGSAQMDFAPSGLVCTVRAEVGNVIASASQPAASEPQALSPSDAAALATGLP